jgi:DNA ligase-1
LGFFQVDKIKVELKEKGDLGIVAQESRQTQTMLSKPKPLTVPGVFAKLREVAQMSGNTVSYKFFRKIVKNNILT